MEFLPEFRVAGLGVQVLFGFLLSLPFSVRFPKLDQSQAAYLVSLTMSALSTVLLCSPVAYHRMVFRMHKAGLLYFANAMALIGLITVALAISAAVLLVVSSSSAAGSSFSFLSQSACVAGLWFAMPLNSRLLNSRHQSRDQP